MVKKSSFFILIFLCLVNISLVSSAPPFEQIVTNDKTLQLEIPVIEYRAQDTTFKFHVHAFNSSDGKLIPQGNINYCMIHLYSPTDGGHLIEDNMTADSNGVDFEYIATGGNFTELGQYAVLFYCEVDPLIEGRGGFFEHAFMITKTGHQLNLSESVLYFVLAFGVLLLFALSFYFMIATEYGNEVNEKGAVVRITKLKYVKLALILLTWVLFTWFLNILIGLSDNFVSLTMYYGFFGFIFNLMNTLSLWVGIVVLVIAGAEIVRDANIMDNIKKSGSSLK